MSTRTTCTALAESRRWRLLIGGKLVDSARGGRLEVFDPSRGELVTTVPLASSEDVHAAAEAAAAAFPAWRETPLRERANVLVRIAETIEKHAEELACLDTLDTGTPIKVMRGDARLAAERLRYFAGLALQLRGETIPTPESHTFDFTLREPYGVVARIVPFNHPLMFAAAGLSAPLIAGNTVVIKPSEHTCLAALRLGELLADRVPAGVVNIVTGPGQSVGDELVRHPAVRRIAFTGGVATGRAIQRSAAEAGVKTVTLELGGKNPLIVFADCDLEAAIQGAVRGMNFTWQGQSCGSTSRLFVHHSLFEQVVEGVRRELEGLMLGDPFDERTDIGALTFPAHYERVRGFLALGESDTRTQIVTGGLPSQVPFPRGLYVRPTLFVLQDDDHPLAREEIFGPVLVAVSFDSYEEVIARANRSPYGLAASVWTRELGTALRAAHDLSAGYVWVNSSSAHIPGTSFGGVKDSGIGREEGIEEILGYSQTKNVFVRY
ncbi:MAG: aldehyde dehydrogenase family protein [Sinobacteraceae bacterium]|nr:aldehyde dehydrogenase family protein [Nevskiaceae bacterium]